MFYGPPQWGDDPEHDQKEIQIVLHLAEAIEVRGTKKDNDSPVEKNVRDITLAGTELRKMETANFLGKEMMFEGSLYHSQVAHHHTAILMTVSCVKLHVSAPCLVTGK
jgi:hypothetical protein